jgi:hypothetical protein
MYPDILMWDKYALIGINKYRQLLQVWKGRIFGYYFQEFPLQSKRSNDSRMNV